MTPIDSAGRSISQTLTAASLERLRDPSFDPAAVLLALSAQQMGIMQTTLANQITGARSQIGKIADMGSASLDAGRLRERLIAGEEASVRDVLADVKTFGGKYVGGEQSTLTVGDADNERLKQAAAWAKERGFTLEGMTQLEHPTQTEIDAAIEAGVDPPAPRLVADEGAVKRNLDKLFTYLTDVRLGVADNPAIRRQMAESPGATGLLERLRGLGYDAEIESLADLEAASATLQSRALDAVATLAQSTERIQSLGEAIGEKGTEFSALVKSQDMQPWPQDEADRLKAELRLQELAKVLEETLEEHAEAIAGAETRGMKQRLPGEFVAGLVGKLSDAERGQLKEDLAAWQAQFATNLSISNDNRPGHNSLAEMRRNYL